MTLRFGMQHRSSHTFRTLMTRQQYRLVVHLNHPLVRCKPDMEEMFKLGWILRLPDMVSRPEAERMLSEPAWARWTCISNPVLRLHSTRWNVFKHAWSSHTKECLIHQPGGLIRWNRACVENGRWPRCIPVAAGRRC
jgi:hypothetical protein